MERIELDGPTPVEIRLRRSARARRLSLRVSSLDGRVTLTVPQGLPAVEAKAFAEEKRHWILRARERNRPPVQVAAGAVLPVEGRPYPIEYAPVRSARLAEEALVLPARAPARGAAVFLKLLARDRLAAACDTHASALGVSYSALALRDTRSRWGSCSAAGRLMFSWRLAMAPADVLDYVAAHEVAHLLRMDHSPAFWRIVERLDPDWREARSWLRRSGTSLHTYRFED